MLASGRIYFCMSESHKARENPDNLQLINHFGRYNENLTHLHGIVGNVRSRPWLRNPELLFGQTSKDAILGLRLGCSDIELLDAGRPSHSDTVEPCQSN
jgi:hypothetical protein